MDEFKNNEFKSIEDKNNEDKNAYETSGYAGYPPEDAKPEIAMREPEVMYVPAAEPKAEETGGGYSFSVIEERSEERPEERPSEANNGDRGVFTVERPSQGFYTESVKPENKAGFYIKMGTVAACMLAVGIGIGFMIPAVSNQGGKTPDSAPRSADTLAAETEQEAKPETREVAVPDGAYSSEGYADIIESVQPAVVTITSKTQTQAAQMPMLPYWGEGDFEDYFGLQPETSPDLGEPDSENPESEEPKIIDPDNGTGGITPYYESSSAGTGVLFEATESKYFIATNNHVVSGSSDLSVSIMNSDLIPAKVIGSNPENDLAVLSVEKTDVAKAGVKDVYLASFGDSDDMRVGDFVIAIGNALGNGNTATSGMISSVDKQITLQGLEEALTVIQTDAAINPGNSGGPLINLKGEVIAINTAKISEQVNAEGMGYSIPSNIALPILSDLMTLIDQPYLGVSVGTITKLDAVQYGLSETLAEAGVDLSDSVDNEDGVCAILSTFVPGEAAEEAGLLDNDLVISIDGERIHDQDELIDYILTRNVGDTVEFRVLRDGADGAEEITVSVTLGSR